MPEVPISANKTIAKNTLFLYGRMLFNLVVSLYTSRVVLQMLGVNDYGVYQVVAGVVSLFTFVTGSLAGATSRFLSYELGRGDLNKLSRTFAATLNVHIYMAIILFAICETIGLWFINYKLNIPEERMFSGNVVYQCSILMTILSLLQAPYNASIIAHEKMQVFAYVGILDTILKLIACYLLYIAPLDRLESYGLILLLFTFIINCIYYLYCKRSFLECHFRWNSDWTIAKPILVFSGWQLFGDFSLVAKNQGINFILNIFFGVAVNAACGFANTVYGAIVGFANNFLISIRPAIIKSYSQNNFKRMNELIVLASKFAFSLMLILTVPFVLNSEYILTLWLKTPPEYTAILCQYTLSILLIAVIYAPVQYAIIATGDIRFLSLFHGIALLAVLPVSYLFLSLGYSPEVPFIITLIEEGIVCSLFPYILKRKIVDFDMYGYYKNAIVPCFITLAMTYIIMSFVHLRVMREASFLNFLIDVLSSTIIIIILVYFIVLSKNEKDKLKTMTLKLIKKK